MKLNSLKSYNKLTIYELINQTLKSKKEKLNLIFKSY